MAKLSRIQRNDHLKKVIDAQRPKRQALKEAVSNQKLSIEERMEAAVKLDKLPRDGSPIRYRNRCVLTGRSRGYLRKFGLSRICFRERANAGLIYGVKKASW